LVDVGSFHEPHADVGMAEAIGGAPVSVAVKLELGPGENPIKDNTVHLSTC
jgi:hypothetical protein